MKEGTSSTVQAENRLLAAIMFTDIVGFSRQMGVMKPACCGCWTSITSSSNTPSPHHGTSSKRSGMPSWSIFLRSFMPCSAPNRFSQFRTHNADQEPTEQIHVRIGIHSAISSSETAMCSATASTLPHGYKACRARYDLHLRVVYRDVAKKLPFGTVVSLGKPKAQEHRRTLSGLCTLPEPPKGCGKPPSPTPEALP